MARECWYCDAIFLYVVDTKLQEMRAGGVKSGMSPPALEVVT